MDSLIKTKKIIAIIQARMGSTRTPGKTMTEIAGHPLLYYSVNRVRMSSLISSVIVATTTEKKDDFIVSWCEQEKILYSRGSEKNVLDRYYQTAQKYSPDYVVRITSDCPFSDPDVIDRVIRDTISSHADYGATNIYHHTWPHGLDVEVIKYDVLVRAWESAINPYDQEHVTPYIRNHPELFKLVESSLDQNYSIYRLTVDYPEDLELTKELIENYHADMLKWQDIIQILRKNPYLFQINKKRIEPQFLTETYI